MSARRISRAAAVCLALARTSAAQAQPSESALATARELFTKGIALEDAHDWGAALDLFRRVAAIKPTPQVRYNLGLCLEHTGHLVEAENELSPLALASGDADTVALAAVSKQRLAELRARIPRLLLTLPSGVDATVTLDGSPVEPALLGAPMLVDPGPHTIVAASKTGAERGEAQIVAVDSAPPLTVQLTLASPGAGHSTHLRIPTLAWATGGVAVASLGAALGLGIARLSAVSSLNDVCGPGGQYCPASAHGKVSLVDAETIAADVLAGVGVASALATGILIKLSPSAPSSRGTGLGVSLEGTF